LTEVKKYSESELIELLQQRDGNAFEYLYDNYSSALYGVIIRMVEEKDVADDLLQDAFIKIWNNFTSYDSSKGRLFTWMINLTRNLTIDMLRSKSYRKQQKIHTNENAVNDLRDERYGAEKFDTIGLRKQLSSLKNDQREIIQLAYFSGFTQEEIAKHLGIPLGTVKTRMRTAIIELRKMLEYNG
jgi:RNA polymerase sigma factor (sigma-70 family)